MCLDLKSYRFSVSLCANYFYISLFILFFIYSFKDYNFASYCQRRVRDEVSYTCKYVNFEAESTKLLLDWICICTIYLHFFILLCFCLFLSFAAIAMFPSLKFNRWWQRVSAILFNAYKFRNLWWNFYNLICISSSNFFMFWNTLANFPAGVENLNLIRRQALIGSLYSIGNSYISTTKVQSK